MDGEEWGSSTGGEEAISLHFVGESLNKGPGSGFGLQSH